MKKYVLLCLLLVALANAAPAFASNPFADVPAGHWAYDAVAQLAARGIVSGYPDGAYKGVQPATRYEIASVVARAMTRIDIEKASSQDIEVMKKLTLEFKDELDALGATVDRIDGRVAKLEDGIGGWQIRGMFIFDASFANSDGDNGDGRYAYTGNGKKNEFTKERFRLFLTKRIDEKTYFYTQYRTGHSGTAKLDGRGDMDHGRWAHMFVDTKLGNDMDLRVGRFTIDFELDYELYNDGDAMWGDFRTDGFRLRKRWNALQATAVVGRNNRYTSSMPAIVDVASSVGDHMTYILDLNYTPGGKFFLGMTGFWGVDDATGKTYAGYSTADYDFGIDTYAVYGGYTFTPGLQLKGIYYHQKQNDGIKKLFDIKGRGDFDDSAKSWKAILDVKQDVLKYTSLWFEYSQTDNNFWLQIPERYGIIGAGNPRVGYNTPWNDNTSKYVFVKAVQQWTKKWSTILRYVHADYDTAGMDDAAEWGAGLGLQYTPSLYFELMYDQIDYGDNSGYGGRVMGDRASTPGAWNGKESVVRFRTIVTF